jgi:hypothetical protein
MNCDKDQTGTKPAVGSTKEDLRTALAIAFAERRGKLKKSEIGWKRKAMVSRVTLLRVHKSLKTLESSNPAPGQGIAFQLLEHMKVGTWDWKEQNSVACMSDQTPDDVKNRCSHLEAFMHAVEVCVTSSPCQNLL